MKTVFRLKDGGSISEFYFKYNKTRHELDSREIIEKVLGDAINAVFEKSYYYSDESQVEKVEHYDDDGNLITDACGLMLHDDNKMLTKVYGNFDGEQWSFEIPAETTKGLSGRFWYCICRNNTNLCFKTPIYLM